MKAFLKISLMLFMFLPSVCFAQMDLEQVIKPESGKPINIKSDSMVIRNKENLAIFTDNVHVIQGAMTLNSDQLKVYSDYDEKTKKNKFRLMEAEGNVDFNAQDKSVQSNKATYDVISGILVLEGNVHLQDTNTDLRGKIFRYDVRTGRSEIRNTGAGTATVAAPDDTADTSTSTDTTSNGRVRAVFTPGKDIKNFTTPMESLGKIKNPDNEEIKGPQKKEDVVVPPPPRAY